MMTVIRKTVLSRGVRCFCAATLAVAVLLAGTLQGHAALQAESSAQHAETVQADHHGGEPAAQHHTQDCHDPAKSSDAGTASKHGAMHGCCANACFPSVTTAEFQHTAGLTFSVEKLAPGSDQAAASGYLKGLFKPPRRHG
jgi:hypothetical protein